MRIPGTSWKLCRSLYAFSSRLSRRVGGLQNFTSNIIYDVCIECETGHNQYKSHTVIK